MFSQHRGFRFTALRGRSVQGGRSVPRTHNESRHMLSLIATTCLATSDHWAVLVAGSRNYGNYRHQADVCHAYQVVIRKGIPAKQVIVMAYDDIASDKHNPFPGKIFNAPSHHGPGIDVYKGCKIDYSGIDVTPQNFVKVLDEEERGNRPKIAYQLPVCVNQDEEVLVGKFQVFFSSDNDLLNKVKLQSFQKLRQTLEYLV